MQENDSDLIERLRDSDGEALRELFEKYQPLLFRGIAYVLQDVDAADDIVQETFLRVWSHRTALDPRLPILGYLLRVSRNLALDAAKHRAVERNLQEEIPPRLHPSESDPMDELHHRMLEEKVAEVIRTKMPVKCREVYLLSRLENMSNAEISRQLGISVKTVENQITRGGKILRRRLRGYFEG
jgi:RNA polymerase sigma-70 factor, ECF subfamily